MGDHGTPLAPRLDPAEVIGVAPVDHVQRRFLYVGRILVTGGFLVLTYTISNSATTTNGEHTLFGLALLFLGVFMVMLSPVANQFPVAARAGSAVADFVLSYFFGPGN